MLKTCPTKKYNVPDTLDFPDDLVSKEVSESLVFLLLCNITRGYNRNKNLYRLYPQTRKKSFIIY